MKPNFRYLAVMCPLLAAAACTESIAAPEEPAEQIVEGRRLAPADQAQFNPQPEPPASMRVLLYGPLHDLRGDYRADRDAGRVSARTLSSVRRGDRLYVTQQWTLHPPEPVRPMVVELTGVVDLASSTVLLTGRTAQGVGVTMRGEASFGGGGLSIGGDVMFNPQPDPPKTIIG
jgi:hypothetical protein